MQPQFKEVSFQGVEPVDELREELLKKNLEGVSVVEGDATNLEFADGQFDCTSLFGVLHHVAKPELAIKEALRVSKKITFLSDHNVYGMGSVYTRRAKQLLRDLGLRRFMEFLLTKGKGYCDTDWDGVFYPFSLLDHLPLIRENAERVYCFPAKTFAVNLYREASHVAILAVK